MIAYSESTLFKRSKLGKVSTGNMGQSGTQIKPQGRQESQIGSVKGILPALDPPYKNLAKFVEEYFQKKSQPSVEPPKHPIFGLTRLDSGTQHPKKQNSNYAMLMELLHSKMLSHSLILVPQMGSDLVRIEAEKSSSMLNSSKMVNPRTRVFQMVANRQIYPDDTTSVETLRAYLSKAPPETSKKIIVLVYRDKERIKSIVKRELEYSKLMLLLNVNTYGKTILPVGDIPVGDEEIGVYNQRFEENIGHHHEGADGGHRAGWDPIRMLHPVQKEYSPDQSMAKAPTTHDTWASNRGGLVSPVPSKSKGGYTAASGLSTEWGTDHAEKDTSYSPTNKNLDNIYKFVLKETNLSQRLAYSPHLFLVKPPIAGAPGAKHGSSMGINDPAMSATKQVQVAHKRRLFAHLSRTSDASSISLASSKAQLLTKSAVHWTSVGVLGSWLHRCSQIKARRSQDPKRRQVCGRRTQRTTGAQLSSNRTRLLPWGVRSSSLEAAGSLPCAACVDSPKALEAAHQAFEAACGRHTVFTLSLGGCRVKNA